MLKFVDPGSTSLARWFLPTGKALSFDPQDRSFSLKENQEMGSLRVLAFSLLLPLVCATHIKYCDNSEDYVVKVSDVKISPDPVVPGKPTTFDISASTGQNLSNGKVVIRVTFFGIQVHTETHDLCEEMSCPIAAGKFVLSHTQSLPVFTPPGLYTLRITMEDDLNQQLTCISFNFRIGFGSLAFNS